MRSPYQALYFEISGHCNARCAYCHSGVQRRANAKFIDVRTFRDVLQRLLDNKVIQRGSVISLYDWGEPFLHPHFREIVGIVNALGLRYAVSTNSSRPPVFDRMLVKNLDHIIFSMPGFSQESYNRIHGFRFEDIKANIDGVVNGIRKHGFRGRFMISYHVYRFNVGEMKACERFADERGIRFNPYYAILNHWWEMKAYLNNTLPEARRAAAERDLFTLEGIHQVLAEAPKSDYRCPQNNYLNIDENGEVVTCCQIPREHPEYSCGDALSGDLPAMLEKKVSQPVCKDCIGSGMAYFLNTALRRPYFYLPSFMQRVIHFQHALRRIERLGFRGLSVKIIKKVRRRPNAANKMKTMCACAPSGK